jgi:hypothetical protein
MVFGTPMPSILLLFVMVGLLFSGCLGARVKSQTVEEFLQEVSVAYISMDSDTIADLWAYPIIIQEEDEENPAVKMERDELKSSVGTMMLIWKTGGVSFAAI